MKTIIKNLEKQLEKLRELIQQREDHVSDKSEKWQESEKCVEYEDKTVLCMDCKSCKKLNKLRIMKWIELESKLPEQEVPVLLYIDCSGRKQIVIGAYLEDEHGSVFYDYQTDEDFENEPLFWQHLPDEPKEDLLSIHVVTHCFNDEELNFIRQWFNQVIDSHQDKDINKTEWELGFKIHKKLNIRPENRIVKNCG